MTYHPVEARSDVVLSVVVCYFLYDDNNNSFKHGVTVPSSSFSHLVSSCRTHKKKNNQDICERPKLFIMKGFVLE